MNKIEFIARINQTKWRFEENEGKGEFLMNSPDPKADYKKMAEDYATQHSILRGYNPASVIYVTDKEIEAFTNDSFDTWFTEKRLNYRFKDDWEDAFKGSEFLIPVVKEELSNREGSIYDMIVIHLEMLKDKPESEIQEWFAHYIKEYTELRDEAEKIFKSLKKRHNKNHDHERL